MKIYFHVNDLLVKYLFENKMIFVLLFTLILIGGCTFKDYAHF